MNKLKKIIITMMIGLITIIGFSTSANAATTVSAEEKWSNELIDTILEKNIGETISIDYRTQYLWSDHIYCIQHKQQFRNEQNFIVQSKVTIIGNELRNFGDINSNNVLNRSSYNAKLAFILNSDNIGRYENGSEYQADGKLKPWGSVSNAIWNFINSWVTNVGNPILGLDSTFGSGAEGSKYPWVTELETSAENYANQFKENTDPNDPEKPINIRGDIKDNTNRNKIKADSYTRDNRSYIKIGPFNWTFSGTLQSIQAEGENGKAIYGLQINNYSGNDNNWSNDVNMIQSGKDFYVSIPTDLNSSITKLTKLIGYVNSDVKCADLCFLKAKDESVQNLIVARPYEAHVGVDTTLIYDIPLLGNLELIKVNKNNHNVKLAGVGFIFQNQETQEYLTLDASGKIGYTKNRNNATEWKTDKDGKISIKDIKVGTYMIYEIENPNYGYKVETAGTPEKIEAKETTTFVKENEQIYVKISGFVWKDVPDSKTTDGNDRNNLFAEGDETQDLLFDGITVRLKDRKTGETVKETKTKQLPDSGRYKDERGHDGHGEYLFEDVLIEKLQDYYIEFEYDGITYTNVVPNIDKNNGSKASESEEGRATFNSYFSKVEGGNTRESGITRDAQGNKKYDLSYNIDETKGTATLINNGQYTITANTDVTGYIIKDHFTYGQEEIKHINLGLYEREQPDIQIAKDIHNVKLTINGYGHTYMYSQRIFNQGKYEDGFNVGVRYGLPTKPYSAAIYKSDYLYENEDQSKELKAYITYQIAITNSSGSLKTKVNSLVDYFDSRYSVVSVGTNFDENTGNLSNLINYKVDETFENGKFKKMIIDTNTMVDPTQSNGALFVQFALSREAIAEILEDESVSDNTIKLLDNVVEVNSYSIYQDDKIYAGIDKNSAPANAVPGEQTTYENDTSKAPALKLEIANAREMTGKVFLDGTSPELMTGKIREGDGEYKNGEKGIQGVQVTLKENSGSEKEYNCKTNESGDFKITDYIPGDYTLTYKWGDTTYTVQNYKGTIYKDQSRQNDTRWYKKNVETRLSDAIDDWTTRQNIDNEMKEVNKDTKTSFTIDKMNSTTPKMEIAIENVKDENYITDKITTSSYGDELKYRIENLDFGIVERARQKLELEKRVKTLKITLANGQVISDVTVNEDGTISGLTNNITYMKPDQNAKPSNGYIKVEIDNEMLQGSKLEVGYSIKATNSGELDYVSEDYYKYGSQVKNKGAVVTVTPSGIIDYLDKDWAFNKELNPDWQLKTLDEAKDLVAETVYNNEESTIDKKTILYTTKLSTPLEPTKSSQVMLNVSKILTSTDEISLDNETEIVKANKNGGSDIITTLGNYIPGVDLHESDDSMAETTIVTPPTGESQNYIIPVTLGISTLIILGCGIVIIKKKVLNK